MNCRLLFLFLPIFALPFTNNDTCPTYSEIYESHSLSSFNSTKYQGEWYIIAHNEPTEPKFVYCDRMTWLLDDIKNKTFKEDMDTRVFNVIPLYTQASGVYDVDPTLPGLRTEGAPSVGFALIPNMVLYVERDKAIQASTGYEYTAAIVFSCKENYLFQKVFKSLQIFSRTPLPSDHPLIDELIQKAQDLGLEFDPSKMKRPQIKNCKYPPSRLPLDFQPK